MHRGGALRKCVCVRVCSLQNCVLYIYILEYYSFFTDIDDLMLFGGLCLLVRGAMPPHLLPN